MARGKRLRRGLSRRLRRSAAPKQQAYRRHEARTQQTSPPQQGCIQAVACGILFVALIALKLVMPGNLSAVRETLAQWLVRDADFVSAFSAVGRAVSDKGGIADSLSDAYVAVFGKNGEQEVSGDLIGAEISDDKTATLPAERELPEFAVAEQHILGFDYVPPLEGETTSPFGWREHPATGEETFHYGVDLAASEGTEIACFADGAVGVVGDSVELGKYVTVNHENGVSTLYAHCSAVTVKSGAEVKKGETVGHVGSTGNATGAHLHFEIHDGKEYLNPVYYLVS